MAKRKRGGRPAGQQPPVREPRSEEAGDQRRWLGIVLAVAAVVGYFTLLRALAPNPWDYDEYFHVGVAREFHSGVPESFRWTPFYLAFEHFADKELLFHVLLMPFTGFPIERAAMAGAMLG